MAAPKYDFRADVEKHSPILRRLGIYVVYDIDNRWRVDVDSRRERMRTQEGFLTLADMCQSLEVGTV